MKQKILAVALIGAIAFPLVTHAGTPTLDEVVVTATRMPQSLDLTIAHTTVLNEQEIKESGAPDALTLLSSLEGVEVVQNGGLGKQSSIFMRGANSSQVLVLLDGVRINSATTGATALDQLMLDQIERIEVVRGNVSSLYGSEAIGGVIQIFTRHGRGEPALNVSAGSGSHGTQRLSAGFSGSVETTSFSVNIGQNKTDGFSAIKAGIAPTANPDNDGYDNTSLSGSVKHMFDANNSLSASAFQSNGDTQYDSAFGAPADLNTSKSTLSKFALASENRFSDAWQSKLQLSQGVDNYKDYLNSVQGSSIKTGNRQIGWQNTLKLSATGSVLLGLEKLDQKVASTTAYAETERKVNSVFAGYSGYFGQHQVQANLRQDRYSDFGAANTWSLGVAHALGEAWRASVSTSTAFKAPTFNDMYGPAFWGSNPSLDPERSRNGEVGVHYAANGQNVDVIYFDSRTRNLIAADNTWTLQNLNSARNKGVEVGYNGQFGDTRLKAGATMQNPHDADTGQALLRRAKSFADLGVTQQLGAWKVGGEWQYSGKREDYDINTFARTILASYSLVNLTANYDISKQLQLTLRADNLSDKDYMLAHGYSTPGRTLFVGLNYR